MLYLDPDLTVLCHMKMYMHSGNMAMVQCIKLASSVIESNKLHFMMKEHFEFLSTKFELATLNNSWDISIIVQPS